MFNTKSILTLLSLQGRNQKKYPKYKNPAHNTRRIHFCDKLPLQATLYDSTYVNDKVNEVLNLKENYQESGFDKWRISPNNHLLSITTTKLKGNLLMRV